MCNVHLWWWWNCSKSIKIIFVTFELWTHLQRCAFQKKDQISCFSAYLKVGGVQIYTIDWTHFWHAIKNSWNQIDKSISWIWCIFKHFSIIKYTKKFVKLPEVSSKHLHENVYVRSPHFQQYYTVLLCIGRY